MSAAGSTSFTIVGAGGLGGPAAYALAAAGARTLTLCDPDRVELSNLHRQVQFSSADVGRPKVEALADELLRRGFSRQRLRLVPEALTRERAGEILSSEDVVLEGSDDPETKFAVNDWAVAAGARFVIAGVLRYGGQVFARAPGAGGCYRCLFEAPPEEHEAQSCAEAGVLGPAAGVLGAAAARAALSLIGKSHGGALEVWDDVTGMLDPRRVRYNSRPGCTACAARPDDKSKEAS